MVRVNGKTGHGRRKGSASTLLLCLLLSLLLHLGLAWMLDLLPRSEGDPQRRPAAARSVRHVQVLRSKPKEKPAEPQPQEQPAEPEKEQPFVKTSADEPERRPEHADFTSNHDSVASGEDDAPRRQSDAPLPTLAGKESEEEIVTFDQERQDGELEHEGKLADEQPPQPADSPAESSAPLPPAPLSHGNPDGAPHEAHPQGEGNRPPQPESAATAALNPAQPSPGEGLRLDELHTESALTLHPETPPPAPMGLPEGTEEQFTPPQQQPSPPRRTAFDPSLAAHIRQAGLRTYERRTRSTGRFIFGRRPALDVAATPRGHYEAEIYRRIARVWYAACDEHRGDIIPGSITISLRLTRSGGIDSMVLMRRIGASIIQQSFSFGAIRHAALPPMPKEVQQSLIGELYEMILTFNFD